MKVKRREVARATGENYLLVADKLEIRFKAREFYKNFRRLCSIFMTRLRRILN
jgi:hypothetical protein